MYQAIIFDFFGVIGKRDFYETWLKVHGYKRENEFLSIAQEGDTGKITLKEYYSRLSTLSHQPLKDLQKEMNSYIEINEGVVRIIDQLSSHYKIGLLSTAPAELLRAVLQKYDLMKYFDAIIISSDVGMTKSNPHIFALMLERIKVGPNQTVFIDDLKRCIEVAKTVGITGIQFLDENNLITEFRKIGVISDAVSIR